MVHAKCVIYGCASSRRRQSRELGISFHEIPSSAIREKWFQIINNPLVRAEDKVCSLHFREEDFRQHLKKRVLIPGAVPTLHLQTPPQEIEFEYVGKGSLSLATTQRVAKKSKLISSLLPPLKSLSSPVDAVRRRPPAAAALQTVKQELMLPSPTEQGLDPLAEQDPIALPRKTYGVSAALHAHPLQPKLAESPPSSPSPMSPDPGQGQASHLSRTEPEVTVCYQSLDHSYSQAPVDSKVNVVVPELNPDEISSDVQVSRVPTPPLLEEEEQVIVLKNDKKTTKVFDMLIRKVDAMQNEMKKLKQLKTEIKLLKRKNVRLHGKCAKISSNAEKERKEFKKTQDDPVYKQLLKLQSDASDKANIGAHFLLDQIKYYHCKRATYSESTLQAASIWYQKGPKAYLHARQKKLLTLPSVETLRRYLGPVYDVSGLSELMRERLTAEVSKLKENERYVTLYVDEMEAKQTDLQSLKISEGGSGEVTSNQPTGMKSDSNPKEDSAQDQEMPEEGVRDDVPTSSSEIEPNASSNEACSRNHVVSFVLGGLTTYFRSPCAHFILEEISGHKLCNITKEVIKDVEKLGFKVVRVVVNYSSITTSMLEFLRENPLADPNHPSTGKTLFVSFDNNALMKQVRDQFMNLTLKHVPQAKQEALRDALKSVQSTEAMNPAHYFMCKYLKLDEIKNINMQRSVQAFSGPVIEALSILKKKSHSDHTSATQVFGYLQKWQAVENILNFQYNFKNSSKVKFISLQDDRLKWLREIFPEYLKSIDQEGDQLTKEMLSADIQESLVLGSRSAAKCLEYLVKTLGTFPPSHEKNMAAKPNTRSPKKRPLTVNDTNLSKIKTVKRPFITPLNCYSDSNVLSKPTPCSTNHTIIELEEPNPGKEPAGHVSVFEIHDTGYPGEVMVLPLNEPREIVQEFSEKSTTGIQLIEPLNVNCLGSVNLPGLVSGNFASGKSEIYPEEKRPLSIHQTSPQRNVKVSTSNALRSTVLRRHSSIPPASPPKECKNDKGSQWSGMSAGHKAGQVAMRTYKKVSKPKVQSKVILQANAPALKNKASTVIFKQSIQSGSKSQLSPAKTGLIKVDSKPMVSSVKFVVLGPQHGLAHVPSNAKPQSIT